MEGSFACSNRGNVALTTLLGIVVCAAPAAAQPEDEDSAIVDAEPAGVIAPEPPWETTYRWNGYLDVGAFDTTGDGAGHVQDLGHLIFPQYSDIGWVFHGDPLATMVNSRGEPADTGSAGGASRAVTFDSVDSRGNPTFLVNEFNLDLTVAPHRKLWLLLSTDFIPRGRNVSRPDEVNLGDFVEIDLAYGNWTACETRRHVVDVQAGKFDSIMGIEYRFQEAPDRFGVTPSLIFRYLGGHPVGVKVRARLFDERVKLAAAVTNGSHFVEMFPFYDEQDRNAFKTGASRLAVHHEGETATLEIGASGLFGAQDQQPRATGVWQWQAGADVEVAWGDVELRAEYVRGRAHGESDAAPCDVAPCLRFQGAYAELAWRATNWVGVMARADWRDAWHRAGNEFVYVVDTVRATAALRFEVEHVAIVKTEYVHTVELEGRPGIANDVATASLVLVF